MKKILLSLPVILTCFLLQAREFWIQPNKYLYKAGETIHVRFNTGNDFAGENWKGSKADIERLFFYWAEVKDNCHQHLAERPGDSLKIAVMDEGTVMLAFDGKPFIENSSPAEFEQFLTEHGQQQALEIRQTDNLIKMQGRQLVQHFAKTILQVGSKTDRTFKKITGQDLEIIPDDNPYSLVKDGDFKVKVYFMGKPLINAPIKVWHRYNEKLTEHNLTTDNNGEAIFFTSMMGQWMVSAVVMEPLKDHAKADWHSFRGSLTWGYDK